MGSGSTSTSATIPTGNYNPNQLANAIMTANALISCTYDSVTGRFTIGLTSNQPILPVQDYGLAPLMGFDLPLDLGNFATSHTSQNVVNLARPPILYLRINDYVGGSNISEDRATMAIYNNAGFGDMLIGSNDTYKPVYYSRGGSGSPVFNEVVISFVDDRGRPIEFNGAEHTLELCLVVESPAYNDTD